MTQRERLEEKWNASKFGVKTRVLKEYSQAQIEYIRKTDTYSNDALVLEIIKCIEKHSRAVAREATAINTKIQKL